MIITIGGVIKQIMYQEITDKLMKFMFPFDKGGYPFAFCINVKMTYSVVEKYMSLTNNIV